MESKEYDEEQLRPLTVQEACLLKHEGEDPEGGAACDFEGRLVSRREFRDALLEQIEQGVPGAAEKLENLRYLDRMLDRYRDVPIYR